MCLKLGHRSVGVNEAETWRALSPESDLSPVPFEMDSANAATNPASLTDRPCTSVCLMS